MLSPSLERTIAQRMPFLWINEHWQPMRDASAHCTLKWDDISATERRLTQFSGLLSRLFPELESSRGIVESPLFPVPELQSALMSEREHAGKWLIKGDHALPISGSIKARGGIYEVLLHAEDLALRYSLISEHDDRAKLASSTAKEVFSRHRVVVGSTGNLGLAVGLMAKALGFQATVHMSVDAKAWKKARLRARGVDVIEHIGDFGAAVAAGRAEAKENANDYFVDDENSSRLFLGYSVAAIRLKEQLVERRIAVDERHPLFVYIPCGVGGAPGGITFGLRQLFGDNVHCFISEPVASPCMLLRLANDGPLAVTAAGLDNSTEADGLAVGKASEFAATMMRPLLSGAFTVLDAHLFEDLYLLERTEELRIEPSAAAALRGPRWLLTSDSGRRYLSDHGIRQQLRDAVHILWTTGGGLVPDEEYRLFHERGRDISNKSGAARD